MNDSPSRELLATVRALAADAAAAEVVGAWRAAGIDSILLKGLTLAEWLYPGEVRPYGDADLLVPPSSVWQAGAALERLGFRPVEQHVSLHAHPWVRPSDGAAIDLHVNLWGPHRPPERVWQILQTWVEWRMVAAVRVKTLNLPARALYVVLHAAQHALGEDADTPKGISPDGLVDKPLEDLRRALRITPADAWPDAEMLADRLGVLGPMAAGLSRDPAGVELIGRLPLVQAFLIAQHEHAPLAIGFARMSRAHGVRAKLSVLMRALTRPADEFGPDRPADPTHAGAGARIRHAAYLVSGLVRTMVALGRARRRSRQ